MNDDRPSWLDLAFQWFCFVGVTVCTVLLFICLVSWILSLL